MASNTNPPVNSTKSTRSGKDTKLKSSGSRAVLIISISAGLVVTIAIVVLFLALSSRPLVSSSEAKEANFSVYSPKSTPSGYEFVKERVSYTNSTFSYIFKEEDNGSELTVTIQAKPDSFDMSTMSEGGSINSTSTRNGALYNLSASGTSQYLLDTGDSLVFFRSNKAMDNATMVNFADDLVKIN